MNPLKEVLPYGFEIYARYDGVVRFDKQEVNRVISVGLGDILRGTLKYGPQDFLSFYEIENILSSKFSKSNDINDSLLRWLVSHQPPESEQH